MDSSVDGMIESDTLAAMGASESSGSASLAGSINSNLFSGDMTSSSVRNAPQCDSDVEDDTEHDSALRFMGRVHLKVDTPQKVSDGTSAFVTYLITSQATDTSLPERVRRRFSEFAKLYTQLVTDYPACAVPPLPDHSRFEYIAGDRFSTEFITKRAVSLERFLFRVTQHPELGTSRALAAFLAPRDLPRAVSASQRARSASASALDQLSDSLINAFSKVKHQSKEMSDARERTDRFEHNVCAVDRAVLRVARSHHDLASSFEETHKQSARLAKVEPSLATEFGLLSDFAHILSESTNQLRVGIDSQFAGALRDMSHYVQALKGMLKQREQRQIDYEALVEYLTRTEAELHAAEQGSTVSTSSYLRTKVNDFRGVDKEQARTSRVQKLKSRIDELKTEVDRAHIVSDQFEDLAKREVKVFERIEDLEMQKCLGGLVDSHIDYFQRVLKECRAIESQL